MREPIIITCFLEDLYYYLQKTKQELFKEFSVVKENNSFILIDKNGTIVIKDFESIAFKPIVFQGEYSFEADTENDDKPVFTFEQVKAIAGK